MSEVFLIRRVCEVQCLSTGVCLYWTYCALWLLWVNRCAYVCVRLWSVFKTTNNYANAPSVQHSWHFVFHFLSANHTFFGIAEAASSSLWHVWSAFVHVQQQLTSRRHLNQRGSHNSYHMNIHCMCSLFLFSALAAWLPVANKKLWSFLKTVYSNVFVVPCAVLKAMRVGQEHWSENSNQLMLNAGIQQ